VTGSRESAGALEKLRGVYVEATQVLVELTER